MSQKPDATIDLKRASGNTPDLWLCSFVVRPHYPEFHRFGDPRRIDGIGFELHDVVSQANFRTPRARKAFASVALARRGFQLVVFDGAEHQAAIFGSIHFELRAGRIEAQLARFGLSQPHPLVHADHASAGNQVPLTRALCYPQLPHLALAD